jgi:amino acid transporter
VITILVTALGERAGVAFSWLAAVAMWFCGLSAVTWCSRVIYAFARDGGLPVLLSKVSAKHQTPAFAIWSCIAVAFVAAVYGGAYSVVTSISVIALYFSYVIPVYLAWRAKRRGLALKLGPWHLGRYGAAINLIALAWVSFISAILCLPDGMRAGKTVLAFTALLVLWYVSSERRRFRGPAWMRGDQEQSGG